MTHGILVSFDCFGRRSRPLAVSIFRSAKHPITAVSAQNPTMMIRRLQPQNITPSSGIALATTSKTDEARIGIDLGRTPTRGKGSIVEPSQRPLPRTILGRAC